MSEPSPLSHDKAFTAVSFGVKVQNDVHDTEYTFPKVSATSVVDALFADESLEQPR